MLKSRLCLAIANCHTFCLFGIEGASEGAIEGVTKGVEAKLAILLSAIAANEGNRVLEYKEATGLLDSSMVRYTRYRAFISFAH